MALAPNGIKKAGGITSNQAQSEVNSALRTREEERIKVIGDMEPPECLGAGSGDSLSWPKDLQAASKTH